MARWKAVLIVLIGAGGFGFTPVFVKSAFIEGYNLAQVVGAQMMLAFVILWIIAAIRQVKRQQVTRKQVVKLMVAGSLNGSTGIFYYGAMAYLPSSVAIIMLFQFVWIGVLYEWILDKRKPTPITLVSVVLTLIGVSFAANLTMDRFEALSTIGLLLGLAAAFSYAGFIYVSGRVVSHVDPFLRSPIMISGAAVLVLCVFPPTFLWTDAATSSLWLFALGAAIFGAVLPPLFMAIGVPHISSGVATVLGSAELPVAILMAAIVLHEPMLPFQWVGIALIMLAICLKDAIDLWSRKRAQLR
ncbi:EamA family transporter [Aureibacillus halotolerans]|uniref:Threonine/homoserine efflux transporter RhtA n=1 Tax=Aureibacillus halotolerans TaxID=1508390 RepID=A0A4R6UD96_9BACI|nr:DMT family transporter [Aureibacillus halotolerans]TDQ42755.1 threonine/homoserine efflux transporter RhtA [Aureibacillus halotolerans]